mgnify:CR=1 FL=1
MSTIKVNTITKRTGSTLTLGESGTTVTLACGATQTGFGRTGTVDWQTSSIKTTTFTAANGEGYFADTSSGAFTMNLPAGTAGNIVSVVDYTNTFQTHGLTISPNGSQKIGGVAADITLTTEGQSVTLVYVDDTEGWKNVQDSTSNVTGNAFVSASGGDAVITCGNFKTHIFTSSGTFTVSQAASSAANNTADYYVVAGGGGAGGEMGGGGGGGGFRISNDLCMPAPGTSPLANPTGLTLSAQAYPITVGAGGAGGNPSPSGGCNGANSVFSTITSAGGGFGKASGAPTTGGPGGSGGGGGGGPSGGPGGSGNTPPVSPPQGQDGGSAAGGGSSEAGGGGGGAGATGGNGSSGSAGGNGGAGSFLSDSVIGPTAPSYGTPGPVSSTRYFSGGGGGGGAANVPTAGTGGSGGGAGGRTPGNPGDPQSGTANTGGGGGGQKNGSQAGGAGGSGIVLIRYKFQ